MPLIEIGVNAEEIAERARRLELTRRFERPDRVPVLPAISTRYLLPQIGVSMSDYFADPEVMLHSQIAAQKWLMETIRTDQASICGPWLAGWVDFQNASEPSGMGCPVAFPDNDIPWAEGGQIRDDADLVRLERIDVRTTGLHERAIRYRREMLRLAEKYPVCFLDGEIFYPGATAALKTTSDGPFTNAAVLMGHSEIFLAVLERPEFVRELLRIVTDKIIDWLDFCWQETGLTTRDFAFTDDSAAGLSAEVYRELVLPEEQRLRDHFDGRISLHMCGKTDHLLEHFVNDLRIDEFQGFGWSLDKQNVARRMGGRVVLLGNVSPMTILSGDPEAVRRETRECLEVFAPLGGYIVQDGNNIAPGSPVENINAMYEAACAYAWSS